MKLVFSILVLFALWCYVASGVSAWSKLVWPASEHYRSVPISVTYTNWHLEFNNDAETEEDEWVLTNDTITILGKDIWAYDCQMAIIERENALRCNLDTDYGKYVKFYRFERQNFIALRSALTNLIPYYVDENGFSPNSEGKVAPSPLTVSGVCVKASLATNFFEADVPWRDIGKWTNGWDALKKAIGILTTAPVTERHIVDYWNDAGQDCVYVNNGPYSATRVAWECDVTGDESYDGPGASGGTPDWYTGGMPSPEHYTRYRVGLDHQVPEDWFYMAYEGYTWSESGLEQSYSYAQAACSGDSVTWNQAVYVSYGYLTCFFPSWTSMVCSSVSAPGTIKYVVNYSNVVSSKTKSVQTSAGPGDHSVVASWPTWYWSLGYSFRNCTGADDDSCCPSGEPGCDDGKKWENAMCIYYAEMDASFGEAVYTAWTLHTSSNITGKVFATSEKPRGTNVVVSYVELKPTVPAAETKTGTAVREVPEGVITFDAGGTLAYHFIDTHDYQYEWGWWEAHPTVTVFCRWDFDYD